MRFRDLAWGAFLYMNRNNGTHGERDYEDLLTDDGFQKRLQNNPQPDDFKRIRNFVAHFGVPWVPKEFAEKYLQPIWSTLKPHISTLSRVTLDKANFSDSQIQNAVIRAFDWPPGAARWGSDTVKSKVLHFFNIQLFVMWDKSISDPYKGGGEGYLEFLKEMQIQAKEAINDFIELRQSSSVEVFLSEKLGYTKCRPLSKLIDQYNWVITSQKWPSRPPNWLLKLYFKE